MYLLNWVGSERRPIITVQALNFPLLYVAYVLSFELVSSHVYQDSKLYLHKS